MNKKVYERHELSAAGRPLTEDERQELKDSIEVNGVYHPIRVFDGKVLDGWNRYTICQELGMDCPEVAFVGDYEAAQNFVLIQETGRNMDKADRVLWRVRVSQCRPVGRPASGPENGAPGAHLDGAPGARGNGAPSAHLTTAAEIAKSEGVSLRTVRNALAVEAKGSPELKQALQDRTITSLKRAAEIAQLPPDEQPAAIAEPTVATPRPRPQSGKVKDIRPQVGASLEALAELRERIAILVEENERLEARNAVLALGHPQAEGEERAAAAELIARLQDENRTLRATYDALKAVHGEVLAEKNELLRQCTGYRKQLTQHIQQRAA